MSEWGKWISVKDAWPKKGQMVLVYFQDSGLMGVQPEYSPIGPCDPYPYHGPSHWMPIPETHVVTVDIE